jgi:hypothetical protein
LSDCEVEEGAEIPGAGCKRKLEAVAARLGAADLLDVVINDYSGAAGLGVGYKAFSSSRVIRPVSGVLLLIAASPKD